MFGLYESLDIKEHIHNKKILNLIFFQRLTMSPQRRHPCKGLKLTINLICDIIVLVLNKEIFYIKITNCYILHLLDLK